MSDQSPIGFEQLGIGALLKRYRLIVPPNQRDYAWEEEQVSTLFEDLALAISKDEKNYFLGTIVTVPVENGVLEVIDGQQRLATTTIALSAMRQQVKDATPNLARALEDFLISVDSKTLEPSPKMRLNTADNDVFYSFVASGIKGNSFNPNRDSHNILEAAFSTSTRKWREIAKPYDKNNQIDIFKKWMNYVEFNAKVILLQVPNTVNAFKMFETLNDRGLKTSQADLVKNYILGEAGDNLRSAQEQWSYIKGALEAIAEEDITVNFLRQSLICQHGYLKESQVYDKVRGAVRGTMSADQFLNEVEVQARDYASLFNYGSTRWNDYPLSVKKSLKILDFFDIKPFRPLLLAVARRFDKNEAAKALQGLVSLGVRLLIASSTRSGSVEQPLARVANLVFERKVCSALDLFSHLRSIIPSDDQFRQAFAVATVSKPKLARYYLRFLEAAKEKEVESWFVPNDDTLSINLEHILPLRPEGNWPNFTSDEVKIYAKRIGNLALMQTTANSNLRSDGFPEKRRILSSAQYSTTLMITNIDDWNPEEIVKRQEHLADLALRAWPFPS